MITNFKAYSVPFSKSDNRLIDSIDEYLTEVGESSFSNYTLMSHDFGMTIEIKLDGYHNFVDNGVNYLRVRWAQDNDNPDYHTYYYFLSSVEKINRGKGTSDSARLFFELDTLNTFRSQIQWESSTHILREHKDRFSWRRWKRLGEAQYNYKDIIVNVDKFPEGVSDVPMELVKNQVVQDPVGGSANGWIVGYWTDLQDGEPTGTPEIRLLPVDDAKYTAMADSGWQIYQPDFTLHNIMMGMAVLPDDPQTPTTMLDVTMSRKDLTVSGKLLLYRISKQGNNYQWRIWSYNLTELGPKGYLQRTNFISFDETTDDPFQFLITPKTKLYQWYQTGVRVVSIVPNVDSIIYLDTDPSKGYYDTSGGTLSTLKVVVPTYGEYFALVANAFTIDTLTIGDPTQVLTEFPIPPSSPDVRTDPKWIKMVESPYTPSDQVAWNGTSYTFATPFTIQQGQYPTLPADTLLKRTAIATINITGMYIDNDDVGLSDVRGIESVMSNAFMNSSIYESNNETSVYGRLCRMRGGVLDSVGYTLLPDPKLLHSDFVDYSFRFDDAIKEIQFERLGNKWKQESLNYPTGMEYVPLVSIDFQLANEYSSDCIFSFNVYGSSNVETNYYLDDPFGLVLKSNRELSIPLYNSEYLNYMRYGYNYDQKSHTIDMVSGVATTIIGAISAIAGIASENPLLIAGGVAGIAGGVTSLVTKDVKFKNEMQKKLSLLRNKSMEVSNPVSLSLFKSYNDGNKLRETYSIPREQALAMLDDYFFFFGYACDYHGIPSLDTRERFNFIRCEADIHLTDCQSAEVKEDIVAKFAEGVYAIHKSTQADIPTPVDRWCVELNHRGWGNVEKSIINHL